ncbi:hypothetical protein BXZ70DRAFT_904918 [Cristinia sonorae]|uniref:Uncharacterized protein n=1 Tax=Cristinia sonorae TaxID=1940300 RepID=A0A8K0XT97_9AGAR|nr:hypothetical protein BXZ70DRAFT_904918 [Cristinia sonorae]
MDSLKLDRVFWMVCSPFVPFTLVLRAEMYHPSQRHHPARPYGTRNRKPTHAGHNTPSLSSDSEWVILRGFDPDLPLERKSPFIVNGSCENIPLRLGGWEGLNGYKQTICPQKAISQVSTPQLLGIKLQKTIPSLPNLVSERTFDDALAGPHPCLLLASWSPFSVEFHQQMELGVGVVMDFCAANAPAGSQGSMCTRFFRCSRVLKDKQPSSQAIVPMQHAICASPTGSLSKSDGRVDRGRREPETLRSDAEGRETQFEEARGGDHRNARRKGSPVTGQVVDGAGRGGWNDYFCNGIFLFDTLRRDTALNELSSYLEVLCWFQLRRVPDGGIRSFPLPPGSAIVLTGQRMDVLGKYKS